MAEDETGTTPDWTTPYGITTPRVDTRTDYIVNGWPSSWDYKSPSDQAVNEDRGQRNELADDAIWEAYEEGY